MATSAGIYPQLHLQRVGSLVLIQPSKDGKAAGPSLTVELTSGTVGLTEHSLPLQGQKGTTPIAGVLGLLKLKQGSALAVITGTKQVCPNLEASICARFFAVPQGWLLCRWLLCTDTQRTESQAPAC